MTQIQKRLIKAIRKVVPKDQITTVVIPWRKCQDVPRFLKRLDDFERRSRKSKLIVGKHP